MNGFDLTGRRAVVTGGSRGIGAGVARSLAAAGARVLLVGRGEQALAAERDKINQDMINRDKINRDKINRDKISRDKISRDKISRDKIDNGGRDDADEPAGPAQILPWDIGNGDSATELIDAAAERLGGVDILVHAAGNQKRTPALELAAEDFDAILGLHLRAAFLLSQAVARRLTADGEPGSIVFIGSLTSRQLGLPDIAAYAAAKSGLLGLARTLANEWARYDIRVNSVLPGFVATEMTRDVDGTPERQALTMRAPMRRFGSPEDIGAAAVYLCSPAAGFVTGETITVDGGWSIA